LFRPRVDGALLFALRAAAALAGAIVVVIALFLAAEALPALRSIGPLRLFGDPGWHPAGGAAAGAFNLTPMLIGTLAASLLALLLATPIGFASALFCTCYGPARVVQVYRRLVELMAGIPSVVYGFWGLVVLTPIIRAWQPPGQSLLAGTLILTLMILPTVALLSEAALRAVPKSLLQGAAALGLTRWATIRGVMLPAARSGLVTAVLLALGRAIGETMAVLMVAGNVVQVPASVFEPVRTLAANIALELGYAMDLHRSALFVCGLVLVLIVGAIILLADRLDRGPDRAY
jgi:phosphate transport system permease protein